MVGKQIYEFEDEQESIKIINKIISKVNKQVNSTIGVAPIMVFNKEKEYLEPLPNKQIMEQYLINTHHLKISNKSLFYYKGRRYSVPHKFINQTVEVRAENNKLYVYYNKELITMHEILEKNQDKNMKKLYSSNHRCINDCRGYVYRKYTVSTGI